MSTPPNPNSKNVLNSDVEVKGTLKFSGELMFDGKVDGDINSDGTLTLGDNAVVKGTIDVGSVVVRGKITGNIVAKDKIELKAKTELFGDVRASKLVIEEGVTFVGKTEVNPNKSPRRRRPHATQRRPSQWRRSRRPASKVLARRKAPRKWCSVRPALARQRPARVLFFRGCAGRCPRAHLVHPALRCARKSLSYDSRSSTSPRWI